MLAQERETIINDTVMEISARLERLKGMLLVLSTHTIESDETVSPEYIGLSYDMMADYVESIENRLDSIGFIKIESQNS